MHLQSLWHFVFKTRSKVSQKYNFIAYIRGKLRKCLEKCLYKWFFVTVVKSYFQFQFSNIRKFFLLKKSNF
jgi:hypothetical protein